MTTAVELDVRDRIAIKELIFRYAAAMDASDWDAFRVCFLPEAKTVMDQIGVYDSCDAVIELYRERFPMFDALQHFVTNVVISGAGDTATAQTYFVSHHVPKGVPSYTYGGTFGFEFARGRDGWRINSHTILIKWRGGSPILVGDS